MAVLAPAQPVDPYSDLTYSLILAVSVCYHARLSDRQEYEQEISQKFTPPLALTGGADEFRDVIRW